MKYMFLMYGPEDAWNDQERNDCMTESMGICKELAGKGKFISTSPLQPIATAATVRMRDGRPLITDGPFAETREQLGGYFILDLADLDEAIGVASRLPPARKGTAEIRPMVTVDGLPPSKPVPVGFHGKGPQPYMLVSLDDEEMWEKAGPDAHREAMAKAIAICHRLNESGKYLGCSPLHPAATATCVRVRNGKREITDGPFAETNEVVGGFYVIMADSREEALGVATEHCRINQRAVEVRPLYDLAGLG